LHVCVRVVDGDEGSYIVGEHSSFSIGTARPVSFCDGATALLRGSDLHILELRLQPILEHGMVFFLE
jgi:hypothetical protein